MASNKQRGRFFRVQIPHKNAISFSKCSKTLTEEGASARQMNAAIDTALAHC